VGGMAKNLRNELGTPTPPSCRQCILNPFPAPVWRSSRLRVHFQRLGRSFPATRSVPSALEVLTQASDSLPQTLEMRPQALDTRPQASEACPHALEALPQALELRPHGLDVPTNGLDARPQASEACPNALEALQQALELRPQRLESLPHDPEPRGGNLQSPLGLWIGRTLHCTQPQ
jgi:hypothetical protein